MFLKYLLIDIYLTVFRRRRDKFEKVIPMRYIKWLITIKHFFLKKRRKISLIRVISLMKQVTKQKMLT